MEILAKVSKYITYILLVTSVILIVQIYELPGKLTDAITEGFDELNLETQQMDTNIIIQQAPLKSRTDFFYASGTTDSISTPIADSYSYSAKYPEAIWSGYITLFTTDGNSKFYIWTRSPLNKKMKLNAWFLTDNATSFGIEDNTKYVNMIYPIVRSDVGQPNSIN